MSFSYLAVVLRSCSRWFSLPVPAATGFLSSVSPRICILPHLSLNITVADLKPSLSSRPPSPNHRSPDPMILQPSTPHIITQLAPSPSPSPSLFHLPPRFCFLGGFHSTSHCCALIIGKV
ncbi:hypothetical protein BJ165DRAFT_1489379 [Panaeolus papilionaceus]|nr:hypothetical protein BJ165DRAFT_1489379 [Panaeolus papilionaceus]